MRPLDLWETYTRQDAHDIFSPDTTFTPQTGTWGLQGIVSIPERPHSYVFFVTFGKTQGDHAFDESITADGVLTWQSQPKQRLSDRVILDFIGHDDRTDSIHLFLRAGPSGPYLYCGTLGYLDHDRTKQQPVHFQWQLMDWPPPQRVRGVLGVEPPVTAPSPDATPTPTPAGVLIEVPPPAVKRRGGSTTPDFLNRKQATHPDLDARNAALGLAGELSVLRRERDALIAAGRPDLAAKVTHVAVIEGDSAGYDIRSYADSGEVKLIEVKTTAGPATTAFFVSPNQIAVSRANPYHYVLMRLFAFNKTTTAGSYYQITGPLDDNFAMAPTEYRAALK